LHDGLSHMNKGGVWDYGY